MAAIEFVPIGNLGNANDEADSNGLAFGRVDYQYNISKYETTYGQYVEFLNAVAKSDPYQLFNEGMEIDKLLNGITQTGTDGNYRYSLIDSISANKPVNYVNFLDAVRFANWMNNGQGTGSTETGAYTIITAQLLGATRKNNVTTYKAKGGLALQVGDQAQMSGLKGSGFEARSTIASIKKTKNHTYFTIDNNYSNGVATGTGILTVIPATHASNAQYWIPTENEWYKAAYYNPTLNSGRGGYYNWATQSDTTPGNTIGSSPNQANIRTSERFTNSEFFPRPDPLIGPNMLTEVGSFTNSASYYGTFDQDGNVTEWNESIYDASSVFGEYNASVNGTRSKRGASFYNPDPGTQTRDDGLMPNDAGYASGFRLASASNLSAASTSKSSSALASAGSAASSNLLIPSRSKVPAGKGGPLVYEGLLSSANELWPTLTPATGKIKLTLNSKRDKATYELNVIGLDFGKWYDGRPRTVDAGDDVAGLHFHHSPFYTVGDVCIGLINPNQEHDLKISYNNLTSAWTVKGVWTAADRSVVSLADSLQYIYAGELYTNIHTERVALGEIRAQFNPLPGTKSSKLMSAIVPAAVQKTCLDSEVTCCEPSASNRQNLTARADLLTGFDGQDVFRYDSSTDSRFQLAGRDRILNFSSSEDLIDLSAMDANLNQEGLQSFSWIGDAAFSPSSPGQLRYQGGIVSADLNGDGRADLTVGLVGAPVLSASNFVL
jgi:hypothetical protein